MMGACLGNGVASEVSEDNTVDGGSSIGDCEGEWYLDVARQVASTTHTRSTVKAREGLEKLTCALLEDGQDQEPTFTFQSLEVVTTCGRTQPTAPTTISSGLRRSRPDAAAASASSAEGSTTSILFTRGPSPTSQTVGLISTPTRMKWVIRMNWTYSLPDQPSICATGLAAKETTPRDSSYAFIRTSVLSCKSNHETINYSPPIAFAACP